MTDHIKTAEILRELIDSCGRGEQLFRRAADASPEQEMRRVLLASANQRRRFAFELRAYASGRGVNPWRSLDVADRNWSNLWSDWPENLESAHGMAPLAACLEHDHRTEEQYARALEANLPAAVHFVVEAQLALLRKLRDRVSLFRAAPEHAHAAPSPF